MLLKLQFSLLSHSPRNFEAYELGVVGKWRTSYDFQLEIPSWNVLCLQFCEAVVGSANVEIFCETEGSDSDEHEDCCIQVLMQCHFLKLFHLCILCVCVCARASLHA